MTEREQAGLWNAWGLLDKKRFRAWERRSFLPDRFSALASDQEHMPFLRKICAMRDMFGRGHASPELDVLIFQEDIALSRRSVFRQGRLRAGSAKPGACRLFPWLSRMRNVVAAKVAAQKIRYRPAAHDRMPDAPHLPRSNGKGRPLRGAGLFRSILPLRGRCARLSTRLPARPACGSVRGCR